MSAGELTLNIENKCQDGKCACGNDRHDISASRETSFDQITGFIAYVHSSNTPFTLKGTLHGGDKLGEDGRDIQNVEKVLVYYWDGDESENNAKPLILEVIKSEDEKEKKEYYIKYDGGETEAKTKGETVWRHQGHSGDISLQDLLDDRNCARNGRVPLDIENPNKYLNFSSGRSKGVRIKLTSSQHLNGSEYLVTTYKITDQNLKLSRVEYNKKKISDISVPSDALDGIRLYSSSGISKHLPIVLELKSTGGGEAKWYYSKSTDGKGWSDIRDGTGNFYTGKDMNNQKPTEALTNKLDEVACSNYNSVIVDLSKGLSTKNGSHHNYCCNVCGNKKVTVKEIEVKDKKHTGSTKIHKHQISGGVKLTAIKFYDSSGTKEDRKRVASTTLNFPIQGPVDIYTFYCDYNPVLIYLHYSNNPKNSRWYRKQRKNGDNKYWRKTGKLNSIKSRHLNKEGLSCENWNKLVEELRKRKCSQLQNCTSSDQSSARAEDAGDTGEQEVDEEEGNEEENETSDDEVTETVKNIGTYGSSMFGAIGSSVLEGFAENALPQVFKVTKDMIDSQETNVKPLVKAVTNTLVDLGLAALGPPPEPQVAPTASDPTSPTDDQTAAKEGTPAPSLPHGPPPLPKPEALAGTAESNDAASIPEPPTPAAQAGGGGSSSAGGSTFWDKPEQSIPTVLTGVGVVSGSLTGFGWWIYKRSKGDPWVRQI